jgi:hypothetical protein
MDSTSALSSGFFCYIKENMAILFDPDEWQEPYFLFDRRGNSTDVNLIGKSIS